MLPLAVDLDGTLIRGDLFSQAMLRFVRGRPWNVFVLLVWLSKGRANAKAKLAHLVPIDPATLPYDPRIVAWIRDERAAGRVIALATASDRHAAEAIAEHLGIFDAVFASDGVINLKSRRKADALTRAYPQGFVYAGNESADLKVWRAAKRAVVVNASPWLEAHARRTFDVERVFPR